MWLSQSVQSLFKSLSGSKAAFCFIVAVFVNPAWNSSVCLLNRYDSQFYCVFFGAFCLFQALITFILGIYNDHGMNIIPLCSKAILYDMWYVCITVCCVKCSDCVFVHHHSSFLANCVWILSFIKGISSLELIDVRCCCW